MASETVNQSIDPQFLQRDGASQAGRLQPALDPSYVSVDERSLRDLLAFAREYARELKYFAVENGELKEMGDWSGFLGAEFDLAEAVAFMAAPEKFSPEQARPYTRPHVALFLTFLQLLRHAQAQLNTLTRRHLDFYYQQVLGLTKKPAAPDQVNVLVDLAPDTEQFLLPAGTLLNARTDSLGQDLFYRTTQDLIANRAQVARLSSVYAEKRVIGLREAREEYEGPKAEAFMHMLQIALGQPLPGDPLPLYETDKKIKVEVDYDFLRSLQKLVDFVHAHLFMDFSDFRSLMGFKTRREAADDEWRQINEILEQAGKARTKDPDFQLNPPRPRDFEANLKTALGNPADFDRIFDGIPEVVSLYDAYYKRERADLKEEIEKRIQERLYLAMPDFIKMMQLKVRIDYEWGEINRILQKAGQKKRNNPQPPYTLPAGADPTAFEVNLAAAIGPLNYPSLPNGQKIGRLEDYYTHFLAVETYFFMSAENFSYLMIVAEKPEATTQEWNRVYTILAEAYKKKVYTNYSKHLRTAFEKQDFKAMINLALGKEPTQGELTSALTELKKYVTSADDFTFLEGIGQTPVNQIPATDWGKTYRIVESAQRTRLGTPVPQKEEWLNLYPAEDATLVSMSIGLETETDTPRWKTFGQAQDTPPPASLGWAVSSPIMALSQGQRTIILTLVFQADQFDYRKINDLVQGQDKPFRVEVSTARGWIELDSPTAMVGSVPENGDSFKGGSPTDQAAILPALRFELSLAENVEPLAPPPVGASPLDASWPALRLSLAPLKQTDQGRYLTHYQLFKALTLRRTYIQVSVTGLTPSQMQNDETALEPTRPFEPFGSRPATGSRFYLGHPELSFKKLDSLTFNFEWMGLPAKLKEHYANYPDITQESSFTTRISLVDKRLDLVLDKAAVLFASPVTINIPDVPGAIKKLNSGYGYERATEATFDNDLLAWSRYLQWELNPPDFQHEAYPSIAAQKSMALAAAIVNQETIVAADYQVNPPYTPKIKHLSLTYTASATIMLDSYQPGSQDRLFQLHPFGYSEIQPDNPTFLPQYDFEGELYLGLQDTHPPQNLSLLFQLAEGSANPDLEPMPVQWSYLSGNRWLSLDNGHVLADTTRGLINSGLITLALPPAAQPSTILPPEFYWLRAAISQNSSSVCDTIAIHAQAVAAVRAGQPNAPDPLSGPLPAGSITDLAAPQPEVAGLRQPYTSYGGKLAEQDNNFYTRISERLRHKQRALTIWDYEHLILEQFPQIYKAKCLPADPAFPGQVKLIVIPDVKDKLPFNPFEPKAPADLLADMETYLAGYMPAFAKVKVSNAHYVPVKVRFGVRFRPGYNEGFYRQRLNDELNRFLSPWAYEEGAEIVIGGRIYANVIIAFLEEQPYVDYVAEIKLFSSQDGRTFKLALPSAEGYWVETSRPDGVLVAARQHEIDLIPEAGYEAESFIGINYMKIELDFIVG